MVSENPQWYCLRTKPRNERLTSQSLRVDAGIEVFCPFVRFERARQSGKLWVTEAMFPCYVFARFSYPARHRQVQALRGVVKIVGFGSQPAVVDEGIIQSLRSSLKDEETVVIPTQLTIGEEVNVISGPFRGLNAVVTRVMPAKERVAILLEVLGMEREIEVSTASVLPEVPHPLSR